LRETADDARSSSKPPHLKAGRGLASSAPRPPKLCLAEGYKEESIPVLRGKTFADSVALNRDRPAARALRAESPRWLDIVNVLKR
jgi:hypothetical protein